MSNQNNNNQGISQQFLDYMINLLKTGYSYQQIVSFLQKYNYPVNTINYYYQLASRRVNTQASQQSYQQQFVQQRSSYSNNFQLTQIADYIKNMEARGYTFQQIKSYLASRGYSSNIIDDAAARIPTQNNNLQQSSQVIHKHEISMGQKTVFSIVFLVLIISVLVGGGFFVFQSLTSSSALLDLIVTPESTSLTQGDMLRFDVSIFNMGDKETFDVFIDYKVYDNNNNIIHESHETRAITTSFSLNKKITFDQDLSQGKYYVDIIANYDDKVATSGFEFIVASSQNSNEPDVPSTEPDDSDDSETNDSSDSEIPDIPTGDNVEIVNFGEFINRIIRTGKNDPNIAVQNCQKIHNQQNIDKCLENVAISFNQSNICQEINDSTIRDDCYLGTLINGDFTVCSQIENTESRSTCNLVKDLYLIQKYEQSGNVNIDYIINQLDMNITVVDYIEEDDEIYVIDLE